MSEEIPRARVDWRYDRRDVFEQGNDDCAPWVVVQALRSLPKTHSVTVDPWALASEIYRRARKIDPRKDAHNWQTTLTGCIKAAVLMGYVKGYARIWSVEELDYHLASVGGVIAGFPWHAINRQPVNRGQCYVRQTFDRDAPRHAVFLCELTHGAYRFANTLGRDWGHLGEGWLSRADEADALMTYGEVWAIERYSQAELEARPAWEPAPKWWQFWKR